jgi:cardiolipin synthase
VALTKHAERYLYKWMLRNGINIYEYQPTVLHAKVVVVDNEFLTVGSYNLNDLSAKASVELNLLVKDGELAREVNAQIEEVIANNCLPIDAKNYQMRLFSFRQLWQFLCFHTLRFLLTIGTFYFRQEE